MDSRGINYLPAAFDESTYRMAQSLVENPVVYGSFVRYILTMSEDVMQMTPFRIQLVANISEQSEHLRWCTISLCSDKYYAAKAKLYGWSAEDEEEVASAWYNLIARAFIAAVQAEEAKPNTYRRWLEKFRSLHKLDSGPMASCSVCTEKCQYQYDVLTLCSAPETINAFQTSVESTVLPVAEAAAEFSKQLSDKTIGRGTVDLAYCYAIHLLDSLQSPAPESQKFSTAAQAMLAKPIRQSLESKQIEAGSNEDFASPMRKQVFEVIVRQAMAGAPWKEVCAGPMKVQRISAAEIEAEIKRRQAKQ